jgi:FkbM family methyltransferase
MYLVNGFYAPKPYPACGRFLAELTPDGLPAHNAELIAECVQMCGSRLRTAVDGGAYVGTWSLHLKRSFDRVIAFEPNPTNYVCLQRNVCHLGVDTTCVALRDVTGVVDLVPANDKQKPFGHQVQRNEHGRTSSLRLDELSLLDLDLLKLDVEGHEYEAICGARFTIQRCKPLIVIEQKFNTRAGDLLMGWGVRFVKRVKHDCIFAVE